VADSLSADRFAFKGDDSASEKNWDQAINSYRKAVELAPEKEELRYGLAAILFQAGRDEESLPIFRQVFREHPIWVEITKLNVMSGDLPNDPPRIKRILDQGQDK
jgi:tetratricopeptide (TPR) repeat protein